MNISYTHQQQLIAAVLVFLGAVCFSTKAVLVKLAYLYEIDSLSLLALRMLFSLPFFLLIAFLFHKRSANVQHLQPISKKDWISIISLGIVGYYLASYFDFIGLQYITASLERLILFVYPTLVVLISALLYQKKITKEQWIALFLTYIGIACAFSDQTTLMQNENIWLGASLVFISALTYAIYLIGSGQLLPRIGTARYTSYVMTIACIAVLVHYIIANPFNLLNFPLPVYGLAFLMAIFSTVTPAFLVSEGIRIIGSSNASIIGSVGPISTIILAYIFLGERIGEWQIFGTFLVIGGVSIIALQKKKTI